jgi:hypothetical protein
MNKIQGIIIGCLFGLCFSCSKESNINQTTQSFDPVVFIDSMKTEFCPDKRVCVFEIKKDSSAQWIGELSNKEAYEVITETFQNADISHSIKLLNNDSYGIISVSTAQLRGEARHSSELVSQGLLGQPLRILKRDQDWLYVQLVDGYLGWMETLSVHEVSKEQLEQWNTSNRVFVLNKNIDVSDKKEAVLTELVAANVVCLLGDQKTSKQRIRLPNGQEGFVKGFKYIPVNDWQSQAPNPEFVIDLAMEYMGIPYVWGGASTKGFDCSGFTKNTFLLNGIQLPRDASQQVLCGESVDTKENFSQLKRGDLLFFGKKATESKKERITHVAIYLDKLSFIHASGEVKIQSLDPSSPLFAKKRLETFIRAKRITKDCIGSYEHKL